MAHAARPARPRRRHWPIGLAVVLALLLALVGGAWWAWRSEAGLAWIIDHVPGLQVSAMKGRPDGGAFEAAVVEWQSGDLHIRIEQLSWRDLDWQWRPYPGAWFGIQLTEPRALRVRVLTAPPATQEQPKPPPAELRLPIELVVHGLHVGALQFNDQTPVHELSGGLHLGADAGHLHRIGPLAARRELLEGRLEASVAAIGPLNVSGRLALGTPGGAALPWHADISLGGTLARLMVDGTLTAGAGARAGVQATFTPFDRWPLASLEATVSELDLSMLAVTLPTTLLSGRAVIHSTRRTAPISAEIDLRNKQPGAWDAGRLPLRSLRATVQGRPTQPDLLEFTISEAMLEGSGTAGRMSGQGRWHGTDLSLALALDALQPSRIDGRLAPMTLGGTLRLSLRGMPSVDRAAPQVQVAPFAGEVRAELSGQIAHARAHPVRILAVGAFSLPADQTLQARIERLQLASGPAEASLSVEVIRDAQRTWHVSSAGRFVRFDPSHWWAGAPVAGRRHGSHSLNGRWNATLAWPQAIAPATLRGAVRGLRGEALLELGESRLGGLPVRGTAGVQSNESASRIEVELHAAGNRLSAQLLVGVEPATDRWQFDLRAPALRALVPLGRLVPGAEPWLPYSGAINAELFAEGRWPALRTRGKLHAKSLQARAWSVRAADARWSATAGREQAPLSLDLAAGGLAYGEQRIDKVDVALSGTLQSHRLKVRATSPLRPPAWTDAMISGGAAPPHGGVLQLSGSGTWIAARQGGGTWNGRVAELRASAQPQAGTPWVEASDVALEARIGPRGEFLQAELRPGRLRLLGAMLQWSEARFEAAAAPSTAPQIALDARLEPMAVAPWLARLQPHFGWGGDLQVRGAFRVRSGERFDANMVVERASGDLTMTDESITRRLGLTDLRLGIAVHDGTWHFTEAMAGTRVGVLSGAQSVRTSPGTAWPTADAPLQGVLEMRIEELGAWSAWLPLGWRVDGRLHANASLAGRFGAPQVNGRITGSSLVVRNLLEGVHLHDGSLSVALRGTEAHIERLVFRAGEGVLRVEGNASLEDTPTAQLRLVAERFEVIGRLDRRIVVSGQASAVLGPERLAVEGRLTVDEGLIDVSQADAPRLDDDVVVLDRPETGIARRKTGATPSDDAADGAWKSVAVSVVIALGDDLRLVGRGLNIALHGQLQVSTTTDGELAVQGTVRAAGTYAAYGQNLVIERGGITFTGELANPRLDILAVRPDIDVRVGVAIQGAATQPRIRLYSEPEMSDLDKLSWLVMGRASEGLGRADIALLQRAALALLAGERGGSQGLVKRLGLDELSLQRDDSGDLSGTIVSLGKQLSRRWYVGYERGLNAAAGSWQLIYRVARRFTLRLQTGQESALDVIWTWRWD